MKHVSGRFIATSFLGLLLTCSPLTVVHAFNIGSGNFSGALDTDLTYGLQYRTENAAAENKGAYGNRALYPDRGDIFSNQVRASVTLDLEWTSNYGALFRGNVFYDFEAEDARLRGKAKDELKRQENLTDAYVYAYFGEHQQLMVRLGKQVISWGENTFIQGSLNDINTVNLSSLRQAGRELKDAFVGTEALYASYTFLDNWTLEGFLLLAYDPIVLDPMGSFWTTLDGAATGGGMDRDGDGVLGEPGPVPGSFGNCVALDGVPCDLLGGALTRVGDNEASNSGQYGVALRRFLPTLFNGTELGFYYQNLHDHAPMVSGYRGTGFYFLDYAEDIERWGASFNTNIAGWAIGGEYSFRDGAPIQLLSPLLASIGAAPSGPYVKGYGEVDRHQLQFTFQRVWGVVHAIGADGSMTLAEVAYGWIDGLPADKSDLFEGNANAPAPHTPGAVSSDFYGLQILQNVTYEAALFKLIEVSPFVAYKWDIDGFSNELGGGKLFVEDRQALTLGMDFSYQGGRYKAGINWTLFSGRNDERNRAGGRLNGGVDRDFVAISLGMSF